MEALGFVRGWARVVFFFFYSVALDARMREGNQQGLVPAPFLPTPSGLIWSWAKKRGWGFNVKDLFSPGMWEALGPGSVAGALRMSSEEIRAATLHRGTPGLGPSILMVGPKARGKDWLLVVFLHLTGFQRAGLEIGLKKKAGVKGAYTIVRTKDCGQTFWAKPSSYGRPNQTAWPIGPLVLDLCLFCQNESDWSSQVMRQGKLGDLPSAAVEQQSAD